MTLHLEEKIVCLSAKLLCDSEPSEDSSTEDAANLLSESIERSGITETCLKQLSKLHREFGADLGVRGYAINFVWTIVLEGVVEARVIIVA